MRKYKRTQLKNGFTVITYEDHSTEIVDLDIVIKTGGRYEKRNQSGYAHLLEHMLMKGSHKHPTQFDVALFTERAGAYFNAATSNEWLKVELQTVRSRAHEMAEFICDIALNPVLDENVLKNEKKVVMQEIDRSEDDRWRRLWYEATKHMLKGHPFGNRTLGTKEIVSRATVRELKKFHEQFFKPGRMALVASGAVDHGVLVGIAKKWFGKMEGEYSKDTQKVPKRIAGEEYVTLETQQSYIGIYFVNSRATEKEEVGLKFVSEFLGGGSTSVLNQEVRQKRGLVYSISAWDENVFDANVFAVITSTTHPSEVVELAIKIVDDFEHIFTKELFEEYKEQIINKGIRQLSKRPVVSDVLAGQWLRDEKISDPLGVLDKIKVATYEDILAVKRKYLAKNRMFIMQLGKERAVFHLNN